MALLNPAYVPEPRTTPTVRLVALVPTQAAGQRVKPLTFSIVLVSLLITGLMSLLLINTMLTANSFTLHDLQQQSRALSDREQALSEELVRTESPESLSVRARELGMVPSATTKFLTLDNVEGAD